jgi:hypothetical protein
MRDAEQNQVNAHPQDEFWNVVSETWMALVVFAFFVIRILGSGTAQTLLSRWKAR